jgi:hypothetical protein
MPADKHNEGKHDRQKAFPCSPCSRPTGGARGERFVVCLELAHARLALNGAPTIHDLSDNVLSAGERILRTSYERGTRASLSWDGGMS